MQYDLLYLTLAAYVIAKFYASVVILNILGQAPVCL